MVVPDRVSRRTLGVGAVLASLAVGPWGSLVLVLLAVAVIAHRIEAPGVDLEHPAAWTSAECSLAERVDQ